MQIISTLRSLFGFTQKELATHPQLEVKPEVNPVLPASKSPFMTELGQGVCAMVAKQHKARTMVRKEFFFICV